MFKPAEEGEEPEPAHTRMAKWLEETLAENESQSDRMTLLANFDAVSAYLEDESNHPGRLEKIPADQLLTTRPAPSASQPDSATQPATVTDPQPAGRESQAASRKPPAARREPQTDALIRQGRLYFLNVCNECHSYAGERSGTIRAPEMRGYGSMEWIERMIEDSAADDLYRSTGREPAQMPPFKDKLTPDERRLLSEWLRTTRLEPARP
jgi:mono/diheme cytochrome c family protein